jgi:hypothetical protein
MKVRTAHTEDVDKIATIIAHRSDPRARCAILDYAALYGRSPALEHLL